ncbi:MAG: folylpolyglutamate synthase/dihydrofolate synthase family protein [Balneolales bacterium]
MSLNKSSTLNFENIGEVHNWLNSIPTFQQVGLHATSFNLQHISQFCDAMGGLHRKINTIHVAGTNGKGATCAILSAVYTQSGYKTGMFTSPHLVSLHERFRIDGKKITDEELLIFFQESKHLLEQYPLTYFEITVAVAFWWFHKNDVDIALIETGLGGRLDATNIIIPLVSVITTISLDHTNYLGSSLQAISKEKAGIIKQDIPVVTGNLTEEAYSVIEKRAVELDAKIYSATELKPVYNGDSKTCILQISGATQAFEMGFRAPVQCHNLAVAWQVIQILKNNLPVNIEVFRQGLKKAYKLLPGRFEKLMDDRDWYFDGAHNKQALEALKETIATIGQPGEAVLIFSLMKDKINENMSKVFSGFKKNYYYTVESQRAATYDDISQAGIVAESLPTVDDGLYDLLNSLKSELVIFTGSFYFYSTVMEWMVHDHAKNI